MYIYVEDIVDAIQEYHFRQSSYYFAQKDRFHDTRIIRLLDYLGKHEQENGYSIMTYEKTIDTKIFRCKIDLQDSQAYFISNGNNLENAKIQQKTYNDIFSYAIKNDIMLKNICNTLSKSSDDPILKKLFSMFCMAEDRDIKNLLSYNNMFAD